MTFRDADIPADYAGHLSVTSANVEDTNNPNINGYHFVGVNTGGKKMDEAIFESAVKEINAELEAKGFKWTYPGWSINGVSTQAADLMDSRHKQMLEEELDITREALLLTLQGK